MQYAFVRIKTAQTDSCLDVIHQEMLYVTEASLHSGSWTVSNRGG